MYDRKFNAGISGGNTMTMSGPGQAMQVGCDSIGSESALLEIMCQSSKDLHEVKNLVERIKDTLFGTEPCCEEPKDFSSEPSVRSEAWESYCTTQRTMELLRIIRDRLTS